MDQRLKERLIGAVVLVALAVWLIPWLLDGRERAPGAESAALELPAAEESAPLKTVSVDLDDRGRPETPTRNAAAPAQIEAAADSPAAADTSAAEPAAAEPVTAAAPAPEPSRPSADDAGRAAPETAAEPAADTPPADTSVATSAAQPAGDWAVQLGSFGEAGNAERLAARVETFGYTPEVSAYHAGGRDLHRVRVGPQPSRARAEAVASALSAHGFVAQVVTAD